ncbi:hypothetical protein PLICRDRAFT_100364 [Plicaturopsis crispa FD-325 SS-3]|nr:hypothetical protein PLICRDRAFT_100364 [Plicaturopsis crispa FD-325 SS-3]
MGGIPTVTRDQVAARIIAGENLVIYGNLLLRITDSWLDGHPGGALAILHFVGRDAVDEIDAFHSEQALRMVKKYAIGTVETGKTGWSPLVPPIMSGWVRRLGKDGKQEWHNEAGAVRSAEDTETSPSSQILLVSKDDASLLPEAHSAPTLATLTPPPTPLSPQTQSAHSKAYRELHTRITQAGLYRTPYITGYGPEVLRYITFAALSVYAFKHDWQITSAIFLGLLWHQLVFTVHDLGHMGVTHNWTLDRIISTLIADFIGGLSVGWWVENHNVHHLVTNHPSHDPDIEYLPIFAITPAFFSSLYSSYYKRVFEFDRASRILISVQHKLFYVILAFARFNLYRLSYAFVLTSLFSRKPRARGGRWAPILEGIGLVFFWTWFSQVLAACGSWQKGLVYLLVSHVVTSPVHVQIVLSHFSMSTADLGPTESFPHRQMRTTTDVACHPSIGWVHGGLHLQVTHHLFPRLPRHNLLRASKLVKEFAAEQGLVYAEFGFVKGNREVIGVLRGVAEQLKVMGHVAEGEVQEAMQKKGISVQ